MFDNDDNLAVSLVQFDILCEDKNANLEYIENVVSSLRGETDLVVLPEMCTTGFSMNSHLLAESNDDSTISRLKQLAKENDLAICGSFIAADEGSYFNRGFFITPYDAYYYDKKHLFRMGDEFKFLSPGNEKLIINYKGFNICLLICYDLRFPVWARNVNNGYDLLLYVANWSASKTNVWNTLLSARAIENLCYVCGVNRTGTDVYNLNYKGESQLVDPEGNKIIDLGQKQNQTSTVYISKKKLKDFRLKFPVWKDADKFKLK